jgi:hypothetical protein
MSVKTGYDEERGRKLPGSMVDSAIVSIGNPPSIRQRPTGNTLLTTNWATKSCAVSV